MFQKTFCSSPWFHLHIDYDGSYKNCRWGTKQISNNKIHNTSLLQFYNSDDMKKFRFDLLQGQNISFCASCHYEESFGKLNGRIRQLNKSAIDTNNFELTMRSSPHYQNFLYSFQNEGKANLKPVDLQIMLSNVCNSGCIMCSPESSSKLNRDYEKLHKINDRLFKSPNNNVSWTQDSNLLETFINELCSIKNLKYIHFLGGETFYDPAFYSICDSLIERGITDIIIGTTTNGTIYNDKIKKYIASFKEFHLGLSIESITELNDYIRWPGKISEIKPNMLKYLELREEFKSLYILLRITPNILSIYDIDKLFEFMIAKNVVAESCNILYDPAHLKIELLPDDIRQEVLYKIKVVIDRYNIKDYNVINTRRTDLINQATAKTIQDYYRFMQSYDIPENLEKLRFDLVQFLKSFESLRNNSILDYLPRYEKFLRTYNY